MQKEIDRDWGGEWSHSKTVFHSGLPIVKIKDMCCLKPSTQVSYDTIIIKNKILKCTNVTLWTNGGCHV